MKPKKAQKILKKLDVYLSMLEIQQPFLTPLTFQQRLDFREYAKSLLIKDKKKEQPTFTQPKEVGEKAISNEIRKQVLDEHNKLVYNLVDWVCGSKTKELNVTVLKTTPLNVNAEIAKGIIYYQSNGTCDVYIDEIYFEFDYLKPIIMQIESNFIAQNVYLLKKRVQKLVKKSYVADNYYNQFGNVLYIS